MNHTASQELISQNPVVLSLLAENNSTTISYINSLIDLRCKYDRLFPSQTLLAIETDTCRRTAIRKTDDLHKRDIFWKRKRFNTTSEYSINPIIIQARHLLWDKFPVLKRPALFLLCSALNAVLEANVTSRYNNLFINKQQTTVIDRLSTKRLITTYRKVGEVIGEGSNSQKERVVNEQRVINLIADAYGLSKQQEEMLSSYSDDALEYAVKELVRQGKQKVVNAPVNWIAKVAASYNPHSASFPKTGRQMSFAQKKVVAPMFNSSHSPSSESSKLTIEERIEFSSNQESIWEEIVDRGETLDIMGMHQGYADRAKTNWKRITLNPKEFPTSSEGFKENYDEASHHGEGDVDYEAHLDEISKDKTDPVGYKLMVRRTDYRKTKRK